MCRDRTPLMRYGSRPTPVGTFITRKPLSTALNLTPYAFVLPATVLLFIIILAPIVLVIALSFTDYTLGSLDWSFASLDNYQDLFSDKVFVRSLRNTLLYVAIVVPTSVFLALIVAICINQRIRTKRFYEVVYFLPVTSTFVAMAIVWEFLFHSRIGPLNQFLALLGYDRVGFLTDPEVALISLAVVGVWKLIGFNVILYLAGLSSIPADIYEAASIDGMDGGLDRLLRITWPMLGPTTMFVAITSSISAFQVFEPVAVLTKGGPQGSTDVVLYQMYLESFQYFEIGYGASITVVFLAVILAFSLLQLRYFDGKVHY
ncbi:ABC transporter permease [Rhizobium tubonense]|uniref:ABC transporter permease n=2 Tax=Rhizobium tubonense TaxID=484088 RepID=A0A2W4CJX3_9HYPH|nr:ABC transporter permease [Rhizobium tubonense]